MIAILQFDGVSRVHLERMLAAGELPALAGFRSRGTWLELDTPAVHFEGAAAYSLSTGIHLGMHGIYYHGCGRRRNNVSGSTTMFPLQKPSGTASVATGGDHS